jgi:acetyl-CoA carboxylase biotin carboxyl carrier protein
MNEPILLVRVEPSGDGQLRVVSPAVGWWSQHPHRGALVGPGSRVGMLQTLNHRFALVLPDGAAGQAAGDLPADRAVPVEFGQTLFDLVTVHAGEETGMLADARRLGHPAGADLPEGTWAVVSPSDGVFYRKPSPDAPSFVEVGATVTPGQAVGLVEVMKTFNQIVYGGPGFPEQATVVEVRADDSAEVRAGQVLLVVR